MRAWAASFSTHGTYPRCAIASPSPTRHSTQVTRRAGGNATQALLQRDREDRIQMVLAQARRAGDAIRLNDETEPAPGKAWILGGLAR